jgi:hypothetical protein
MELVSRETRERLRNEVSGHGEGGGDGEKRPGDHRQLHSTPEGRR